MEIVSQGYHDLSERIDNGAIETRNGRGAYFYILFLGQVLNYRANLDLGSVFWLSYGRQYFS